MTRRLATGATLGLAVASLSACGPFASKASCPPAVQYNGQVYEQVGYSYEVDKKIGTADQPWCDDTGRNPRGNVFDSTSNKVDVYSLPGFDASKVVVYPVSGDLFQVLAAKSLSAGDLASIKNSALLNAGE